MKDVYYLNQNPYETVEIEEKIQENHCFYLEKKKKLKYNILFFDC